MKNLAHCFRLATSSVGGAGVDSIGFDSFSRTFACQPCSSTKNRRRATRSAFVPSDGRPYFRHRSRSSFVVPVRILTFAGSERTGGFGSLGRRTSTKMPHVVHSPSGRFSENFSFPPQFGQRSGESSEGSAGGGGPDSSDIDS